MPRIPRVITDSIVYLYNDVINSETGVDIGGSGFLIGMKSEIGDAMHIYVVTCAHVIESGYGVVRVNLVYPSSGNKRTEAFDFPIPRWVVHEQHDLAVCPMPRDVDTSLFNQSLIGMDTLLSKEEFRKKDIGEGDDLVYVGRFMGHGGKISNTPSVRFGNISMTPSEEEPIEYEVNGKRRRQVGFLVEARSRSGYSGSPVFFLEQHAVNRPRLVIPGLDMCVIGVDWGHIPERVKLKHPFGTELVAEVHSGMMGVVPAWYLSDFIKTSPRLIEQRSRDDEFYKNRQPGLT